MWNDVLAYLDSFVLDGLELSGVVVFKEMKRQER